MYIKIWTQEIFMYIESMDMDESILSPTEKIMLNKNSEI
jgi:hypothetical protein